MTGYQQRAVATCQRNKYVDDHGMRAMHRFVIRDYEENGSRFIAYALLEEGYTRTKDEVNEQMAFTFPEAEAGAPDGMEE
jgi:hypothetical protein